MRIGSTAIPSIVVGTGFGCRVHVPALRRTGFLVAGIVGTRPDKLARKAEKAGVDRWFTNLDDAIEATGAQVVTIATPPDTHARLALQALERGCHVICEKPMAFDAKEAERMLEAAERAGTLHLMGNEFRFQSDRALLGRVIAEGMIGEPRFLTHVQYVPFTADTAQPLPRWWLNKSAGGGWLGASGSHIVDQVRVWLGEFASLSAALPIVSERENVAEDSFAIRFRMENGAEGVLQQTGGSWGPRTVSWRVAGTKGTVWIDDGVVYLADRSGDRPLDMPEDLRLPSIEIAHDADPSERYSHLELGPYIRLCEILRDCIAGKQNNSAVPPATFRDGLATMKVIDAVRQSAGLDGARIALT